MTFLEGFVAASILWFFICSVSFLIGYIRGKVFNAVGWADGYTTGYNACIENHQSELDEEEHGLNV